MSEAGKERERRERLEEETRWMEREKREEEGRRKVAEEGWEMERQRARNLQDVLGEFQAGELEWDLIAGRKVERSWKWMMCILDAEMDLFKPNFPEKY